MTNNRWTETVTPETPARPAIRILAPGSDLGTRYEIRRVLGIGGSAVVYAAFDRDLRHDVALKVLRADRMSDSALKRFRREVVIARDTQSPNLVRVFDFGQAGEAIYLTMELIEGEALRDLLQRGPLPIEEIIRISSEILNALGALHSLGIVHRDIKPGNILLTSEAQVKLADFGLARHWDRDESRVTHTEALVGTLEYLSPEQALGKELDARSDLYSFGILLFEMLTGKVPHQGSSSIGTVVAHLSEKVPAVRSLRADVPRWLESVVARLLEKEREYRYAAAVDILLDFERKKATPRPRRRQVALALSILLLAMIVIAAVILKQSRDRQFARIVPDGTVGIRALDKKGRILWRLPYVQMTTTATLARFERDGSPSLVAFRYNPAGYTPDQSHDLSVIDVSTGKVIREIKLPQFAGVFPKLSNTYGVTRVSAVDLDSDGIDEIVTTFVHTPYWPSYTLIYSPVTEEAMPVLFASGHHRLIATADINGDGQKDLIFLGPNNRMGWFFGLAAVTVEFPIRSSSLKAGASTPDATYTSTSYRQLLWYALLRSTVDLGRLPWVDEKRRRIAGEHSDGTRWELGFDGFKAPNTMPGSERQQLRDTVYRELRDAQRVGTNGFHKESLLASEQALEHASQIDDAALAEWAARVDGTLRIAAGRRDDADRRFRSLIDRSLMPSEVAWDAALHFHRAGDLTRAFHWYGVGLAKSTDRRRGRGAYEFLEGRLMVLAELGRWNEARDEIARFERAFSAEELTQYYSRWIDWRSEGRVPADAHQSPSMIDFARYCVLEFRAVTHDADTVLMEIKEVAPQLSDLQSLVLSLEADLLARSGRSVEAFNVVSEAYQLGLRDRENDPVVRAHFGLIFDRYASIATKAGRSAEAGEARRTYARMSRRKGS